MSTATNQSEYLENFAAMKAAAAADSTANGTDIATPVRPTIDDDDSDNDSDVDGTNSRFLFPGLTYPESDARKFRLNSWVPLVRKHTIQTRFIPLTRDFVDYLQEEGIWLPDEHAPVQASSFHGRDSEGMEAQRDEEWKAQIEEIDSSDEEEDEIERERKAREIKRASEPFFPELITTLQTAMKELGGAVCPCLDYHAPTDATWIMTERIMKCQSIGDILMLLKSSDKIQKELEAPFDKCSDLDLTGDDEEHADEQKSDETRKAMEDVTTSGTSTSAPTSAASASPTTATFIPTLGLRKWSSLHPSKIFRCFVYHSVLLCISQHDPNFYEFLQKTETREDVQDTVEAWLEDDIAPVLKENLGLENYVMDVYIDLQDRCWLVRLKPFWPRSTPALLFSWKEIHALSVEADKEEARRQTLKANPPTKEQIAEAVEKMNLGDTAKGASSSSAASFASQWPSSSSLDVPFRAVPSAAAGMDILRTMDTMSSRFPVEGFDVSDSAAIERWIKRVEEGDLKQK